MRTTNKCFKQLVRNHILMEVVYNSETELHKGDIQNAVNDFTSWYNTYEQKRTPNKHEAFKEWMLGLPSSFSIIFEYSLIHKTLKQWFEKCGHEYKPTPYWKEANLYYHLLTREFEALCKQYEIKF